MIRTLLVLAAFVGGLIGCTASVPQAKTTFEGTPPIQITCTVAMLGDIVGRIGGDRVAVTNLMGPGTDPHLYRAAPSDRRQLEGSDLVLYCGNHLEGNLARTLESFAARVHTVAICERVPEDRLLADEENPKAHDPHLWFDVSLWSEVAQIVGDELSRFDPDGAAGYAERTKQLREELAALHEEVRTAIASIPEKKRVLITAHDAFRYFGRTYGIEVMGVQGLSTTDEAGVRRVSELVELIVQRGISAVFVESTISDSNVRALVEGCQSRQHTLSIGGELFSDAMGAAGTTEGTYVGMIRHNVETIVSALK